MKGRNCENYEDLMFAQLDHTVWKTEMVLSLTLFASMPQELSLVLEYYLYSAAIYFTNKTGKIKYSFT